MLDFMMISTRSTKRGVIEIYPKFIIKKSSDLMIRGGDFYAIWLEERGLWSTDEQDAIDLIDRELDNYAKENRHRFNSDIRVMHVWDAETGLINAWHYYCQKQMRPSYKPLDNSLIFSNQETTKKDYASKKLSYPLEPGSINAYDKIMSTLYSEEERHKIEWAIGAVVTGDSKKIDKFLVLYGAPGSGKGTVLNNVVLRLFHGYDTVFDAQSLGSSGNQFALEQFKSNPLVAVQLDGDLSRLDTNTRINSLVSHERMTVNEKHKPTYTMQFNSFLFMGTNKPVKITDANSGLIRRLIDVSPSGKKIPASEYKQLVKQLEFELGAIAHHCKEVYLADPDKYNDYVPVNMLGATNDFYNFVLDSYHVFKKEDGTTLKAAWEMYKTYCDEAKVTYPFPQRVFKEELKNYFWEYSERLSLDDGSRVRSYYSGFKTGKFLKNTTDSEEEPKQKHIQFKSQQSIFDVECADYPAQYATSNETPYQKWDNVTSKLSELDTGKIHYVKVPENHIVIDFDIPDENGNKCFERNVEEASKWPATYAELSKSGNGVHLHYIYTGDPSKLSRVYDDHIEVKVFTGKSSLRRKLSKCNDLPIATISSGLPLKGENKMVNFEAIQSEKGLRTLIKRNLNKEIHPGTKPSIDFIYKILEDAYSSGLNYDVTDMRGAVLAFAASSTHQAAYCIKLVNKMQFKSEDTSAGVKNDEAKLVFYDVEVFPNLFLVNWKIEGEGKPVVRMINPTPTEIEDIMRFRLVGFNCRRYDNHILYARLMGYDNEQLYNLSQKIVSGKKNSNKDCFFGEAYNVSYTDVYDFAATKQSLKKWEIELGIHHQELGLPWDQPVPEELWTKVAEYCDNDVIATEAVFNHLQADWTARQILADVAGLTVNDTTNTLTTRIIFGKNRKPQDQFHYRNLAEPVLDLDEATYEFLAEAAPEMVGQTHGEAGSALPYFPGYKYEFGKSTYRGEEVGEGGYVYSEPGIHNNVALLDVASMHPTSAICEVLFGPEFTKRFKEIKDARVYIKHGDYDKARTVLDGKLAPYLDNSKYSAGDLAQALKIAINSVYGLTAAAFENAFRDSRNKDNIVAKRGALFMIDLKHAVQKRGYTVAHIKTDSIKIPNADASIIQFVMDFGKKYGYIFEHEATYDRMCLANDAVYVAKYKDGKKAGQWTPTGTQFAVPYVFKKLFSRESIEFDDMCETKSVKSALYLDMNEGLPDVSEDEKLLEKILKRMKDAGVEVDITKDTGDEELEGIKQRIAKGHNYIFVGRVGRFCPVKSGCGGGLLMRDQDGKYYSATGASGYRWLEAETVKTLGKEDCIDRSYYDKLVDAAVSTIGEYGDFERFIADEPMIPDFPPEDELPWYFGEELDDAFQKR